MVEVSVVIPVYNSEGFIIEAIDSMREQSFKDHEIIVIDDGSTDGTANIVKRYYKKVKYIYQQNRGIASARNRGIKEAKGKYIAFLDADDVSERNRLEIQVNALKRNKDAGLVYSSLSFINEKGDEISDIHRSEQYDSETFLGKMFARNITVSASAVMAKKSLIDKLEGFDENIPLSEDYDLWLRMAKISSVVYIDVPLVRYRRHPNNMSMNRDGNKLNEARAILKHDLKEVYGYVKKAYPERADAVMGAIYTKISDYSNAEKFLRKFTLQYPDDATGHFLLGNLFYILNRGKEAKQEFEKSVKAQENFAEACNNLGVIYSEKGSYKKAEKEFLKACTFRNDYRDPRDNLNSLKKNSSDSIELKFTERLLRKDLIPL